MSNTIPLFNPNNPTGDNTTGVDAASALNALASASYGRWTPASTMYTGNITGYGNFANDPSGGFRLPSGQAGMNVDIAGKSTWVPFSNNGGTTSTPYNGLPSSFQTLGGPNPNDPQYETVSIGQYLTSFLHADKKQIGELQDRLIAANLMNPSQKSDIYDQNTQKALAGVVDIVLQHNDPHFTVDTYLSTEAAVQAQQLGRYPNAQEISQFMATLRSAEAAHPSTTTTNYNNVGDVLSSTTTGGMTASGAGLLADQAAQSNPGYGAHQAATTYFNALLNAVGAVNSAGS